jgi:uroporphyrinogen decarboxylase
MRQAGRYLPEYRKVRAAAGDFMTLCTTPELACEVTLQPLARFPLDAAIIFSDILTIPDAMGLGLHFVPGEGPKFSNPIKTKFDISTLPIPDPADKLQYVMDALSMTRKELCGRVPLIGFSGSPWTLATYMVEGGSSKDFGKVKGLLYSDPSMMHVLLEKIAESVTRYLNAQIQAGAQTVMIFDTWGGVLSPKNYSDFSLQYMSRIVDGLTRINDGLTVPVVLFTKNGGQYLDAIAETGCDGIGVDWTTDLGIARALTKNKVALQGNLDPSVLYGSPESITREVRSVLTSYGDGPGHIFNLGHGIHQHVNPDHVSVMVEAVRALSTRS